LATPLPAAQLGAQIAASPQVTRVCMRPRISIIINKSWSIQNRTVSQARPFVSLCINKFKSIVSCLCILPLQACIRKIAFTSLATFVFLEIEELV
jgi:hypothetical protein